MKQYSPQGHEVLKVLDKLLHFREAQILTYMNLVKQSNG